MHVIYSLIIYLLFIYLFIYVFIGGKAGSEMVSSDSGWGQVTLSCEESNETLGCINCENLFDWASGKLGCYEGLRCVFI
jgi:hypothetical protein